VLGKVTQHRAINNRYMARLGNDRNKKANCLKIDKKPFSKWSLESSF
jgi:hypothetical protein